MVLRDVSSMLLSRPVILCVLLLTFLAAPSFAGAPGAECGGGGSADEDVTSLLQINKGEMHIGNGGDPDKGNEDIRQIEKDQEQGMLKQVTNNAKDPTDKTLGADIDDAPNSKAVAANAPAAVKAAARALAGQTTPGMAEVAAEDSLSGAAGEATDADASQSRAAAHADDGISAADALRAATGAAPEAPAPALQPPSDEGAAEATTQAQVQASGAAPKVWTNTKTGAHKSDHEGPWTTGAVVQDSSVKSKATAEVEPSGWRKAKTTQEAAAKAAQEADERQVLRMEDAQTGEDTSDGEVKAKVAAVVNEHAARAEDAPSKEDEEVQKDVKVAKLETVGSDCDGCAKRGASEAAKTAVLRDPVAEAAHPDKVKWTAPMPESGADRHVEATAVKAPMPAAGQLDSKLNATKPAPEVIEPTMPEGYHSHRAPNATPVGFGTIMLCVCCCGCFFTTLFTQHIWKPMLEKLNKEEERPMDHTDTMSHTSGSPSPGTTPPSTPGTRTPG